MPNSGAKKLNKQKNLKLCNLHKKTSRMLHFLECNTDKISARSQDAGFYGAMLETQSES